MTKDPTDLEQTREQNKDAALTLPEKDGKRTQDPDFDCPTDPDDSAAGTAERNPSALRRRNTLLSIKNAVTHVSRVFFLVFLLFIILFTTVSAFRDAVLGFAEKQFNRSTATSGSESYIDNSISSRAPGWLPEGKWDLTFFVDDSSIVFQKYSRPDGNFITISEYSLPYNLSVDTEDAEICRDYLINGHASFMSIKEEHIILVWEDEERNLLFEISVGGAPDVADPSVVIKIAESLP